MHINQNLSEKNKWGKVVNYILKGYNDSRQASLDIKIYSKEIR